MHDIQLVGSLSSLAGTGVTVLRLGTLERHAILRLMNASRRRVITMQHVSTDSWFVRCHSCWLQWFIVFSVFVLFDCRLLETRLNDLSNVVHLGCLVYVERREMKMHLKHTHHITVIGLSKIIFWNEDGSVGVFVTF